ncbi:MULTISPECIES: thioredoxin [unclassified Polaribacter]|uniref:thioredoxin n=1 Tax=unclassified Polaribacter TaxID=196858 RepID=UPI0011BEB1E3|nr:MULTISPECIES: thioredoxin [unclassified Polaribacter]TXD50827.1 thioredoxin [Polaribacter sp. IC063]TXD57614.1 thioredoxin [Polaribacter sp. IC066]
MSKFAELINQEKPVLVDFFAEWCGPCKMMSPILKEVKEALKEKIAIIKIDVDKNQSLAAKYEVRGVPTLVLYKEGKQVWRQSGMVQKKDLIATINSFS